jgi:predicted protein tyrosine phosphatase
LDLTFDDVEIAATNDMLTMQRAASRRRYCEENGLVEVAPTPSDAAAIIDFASRVDGVAGVLLCHCGAGMSRAPAAAIICLTVWLGPGSEKESIAKVLELRPAAVPHVGLIRFADEKLGRGGKLVEALVLVRERR